MQLEISRDDAQFLHDHLLRHLQRVEEELVHTEQRDMQRAIAAEARRLRELIDRITPADVASG